MAGFNYAQNIIGLKNGDIHELEVEVANLSTSVLTVKGELEDIDYEEGSSGVWKWKKYKNGKFELFGNEDTTYSGTSSAWGSLYSIDFTGLGSYPFSISTIDFVMGQLSINTTNGVSNVVYSGSTTDAPSYLFIRGTSASIDNQNVRKELYVRGTYPITP